MPSLLASLFQKTARCPTSYELLDYRRSQINASDLTHIENHLASCDFCSAELQLLNRLSGEVEEYALVEMPAALRRLAEDLLQRSTVQFPGLTGFIENRQLSH